MNQIENSTANSIVKENALVGTVGAFLFSLVGGVMYVLLSRIGYIAAISGFVGVVCAIKGYEFFAKKGSKRGIIISVITAAVVLVIAWYVGFCMDMVDAYKVWYEAGEVEYAPKFFEYLPYGIYDLQVNLIYLVDLLISLGLGAFGCWSYVSNMLKRQKSVDESTPVVQTAERETESVETDTDTDTDTEDSTSEN